MLAQTGVFGRFLRVALEGGVADGVIVCHSTPDEAKEVWSTFKEAGRENIPSFTTTATEPDDLYKSLTEWLDIISYTAVPA